MRIGLLADIHGNVWALEAVLDDASRRRVDRWVDLGDVLYGPLAPRETFELLADLPAVTVRGNEDRVVFEAATGKIAGNATADFVRRACGPEIVSWLGRLPAAAEPYPGVYACHGAPGADEVYLLEDVSSGRPVVRVSPEILRLLGRVRAPLIACAHSHIRRAVRLPDGSLVVNPGSVGCPAYEDEVPVPHRMESGSPDATYAIVEMQGGTWTAEHIAVPYDFRRAVRRAAESGREDWARWLTGRCG